MNNEERLKNLGINIYYWRKKRGLTQKELAEKANVSSYVLSSFEKPDKNKSFSLTSLFKIADALGVEVTELLKW